MYWLTNAGAKTTVAVGAAGAGAAGAGAAGASSARADATDSARREQRSEDVLMFMM